MNAELSYEKFKNQISHQLSSYLQNVLSKIDDNWWDNLVLKNTSSYGRRNIEGNVYKSLFGMNIQLLFKILDENWQDISIIENISQTNKYYIDEIQGVYSRLIN